MKIERHKKYGSWSGAEIESFLRDTRIPMRVSIESSSGPLIVPLWFEDREGRLLSCSPEDSVLVKSLRRQSEAAFDISTNEPPYKGVRGRGLVHCETAASTDRLEAMLQRYLGGTENRLAKWLLSRERPEALIEIDITWLTSWDYSQRMEGIEEST